MTLLDPSIAIGAVAPVTLTVTRYAAPTLTAGRAVAGATSSLTVAASVQPLSSKELDLVPEGMRARGVRKVFSATRLLVQPMPDRFTYQSDVWEVTEEKDWLDVAGYYRYLVTRVTLP